ncbi:MAG: 2,3-bisphosphoglycerate-dependent phosphoglycerate mutase [Gammaproteobacteria bacterium]|jgi:2,3-bisphosphoglycerate-dependent phosphoglycerate mutase
MEDLNYLILVRHGQSEWNAKNLFTGWKDPDLTDQGRDEAEKAGKLLLEKKINLDELFTSVLIRAINTGNIILDQLGIESLPTTRDQSLNERNYGDLAGLNKDDARKKWGEEQVHIWRRSYDVPPPGGESLKNTGERVLPYFENKIKPLIAEGKNILIAAHGNSLRSLIKELDNLSDDEIVKLEIPTGAPIIYSFRDGLIENKEELFGNQ